MLTPTELTKRILAGTMQGVETFLNFTFETCDMFNGWLPTLDTCIRVNENNVVEYDYYEKDTCASMTVQSKSAMNENTKIQILSQDMVRRLLNTKEELGAKNRGIVVDKYAKKLLLSGYSKEQTRRIIKNGIKGFEGKRRSRIAKGLPLRNTAAGSSKNRFLKKLIGKTTWYKRKRSSAPSVGATTTTKKGAKNIKEEMEQDVVPQTVLFVEFSKNGELASRLRELTKRLAHTIGFSVKVVERAGASLRNQFPTTTLWDGSHCGREACITCNQGTEKLPNCKKSSLVYENVCLQCNPGADTNGELREVRDDIPTLYVGESSRTIFERSREHWNAWRTKKEDSHILKHQENEHGGSSSPKFTMRVVKHYRSALSRQVGEAVRIRRRGGAGNILNSKSEYNRCRIPRLIIEEVDEEQIEEQETRELREATEVMTECEKAWEQLRTKEREQELKVARSRLEKIEARVNAKKREQEQPSGAKNKMRKKLKYDMEEEWWGQELRSSEIPRSSEQPTNPRSSSVTTTSREEPGSSQYEEERAAGLQGATHPLIEKSSAVGNPRSSSVTPRRSSKDGSSSRQKQTSILKYAEPMPAEPAGSTHTVPPPPSPDENEVSFAEKQKDQDDQPEKLKSIDVKISDQEKPREDQKIGDQDRKSQEPEQSTTPSNSNPKCDINRKGYCSTHQREAQKTFVTSKKWGDRGGGRGFGYISRRSVKYICKPRIEKPYGNQNIPTESRNLNFEIETGCIDNLTSGESLLLPGGLADDILTG